jgi:carbonic anhydrase/acetyltransferase-like protein (isoleucine patch superfamily)
MQMFEHNGKRPRVDSTATLAPTAVLCGDVTVGPHARIGFGAVLTAESGPVSVGASTIIMEYAVLRGTAHHPCHLGEHVLVGPHAHLTGCTVERNVFLATGVAVFNGAVIAEDSEVRIHAVVHLRSRLAAGTTVPIGWIAVGDPAQLFPPDQHDRLWAVQKELNFPGTVFGMERVPADQFMPEMTRRYSALLATHSKDRLIEAP